MVCLSCCVSSMLAWCSKDTWTPGGPTPLYTAVWRDGLVYKRKMYYYLISTRSVWWQGEVLLSCRREVKLQLRKQHLMCWCRCDNSNSNTYYAIVFCVFGINTRIYWQSVWSCQYIYVNYKKCLQGINKGRTVKKKIRKTILGGLKRLWIYDIEKIFHAILTFPNTGVALAEDGLQE